MSEVVTDLPDPDCPHCNGRGVVGGCGMWWTCKHTHTYTFCRCVNERTVEVPDDDAPPEGWHICDCSEDCGAWEPDVEVTDDE